MSSNHLRKYDKWNPAPKEIEEAAIQFYLDGADLKAAEKKFGISMDRVLKKHGIEKINRKKVCPATGGREKEIIGFYLAGNSSLATSKKFGIGHSTMQKFLDRNGIKRRGLKDNLPKSGGREREMVDLYLSHVSMENVGKRLGVCAATVAYVLKKNDIKIRPPGGIGERCSNWKGGINSDKNYRLERQNKYRNARRQTDPLYKLSAVLRARIATFFRRNVKLQSHKVAKWNKSIVLLGAPMESIKQHIENQFRDGMTWENHGVHWHIDHRIPISVGYTKEELEKLFHYTNLQPLLVMENKRKSNKLNWTPEIREAA